LERTHIGLTYDNLPESFLRRIAPEDRKRLNRPLAEVLKAGLQEKGLQLVAALGTSMPEQKHENRNQTQLPATVTQPDNGSTLVGPVSGEAQGNTGVAQRFKITLVVRSLRPRDWDNNCCKFLQDGLIQAGLLPGDAWDVLQGQIISCKATSKEDEGTEIIIETL
jgi:hypothetical protein